MEHEEHQARQDLIRSDKGFAGCMPACYNEWLDSEGGAGVGKACKGDGGKE